LNGIGGTSLPSARRVALGILVLLAVVGTPETAAATPPGVNPTVLGLAGTAGWYRSAVTLRWDVGTDGLVSTAGCEAATLLSDDTSGVTKTCQATYNGGITMTGQALVKIDKTPPSAVRAVPAGPANANGWYAQPVTVDWTGADAVSGVVGCTSATYSGPDAADVPMSGSCRDAAGNVSAPVPFTVNFDATAPTITGATPARPPDHRGWYLRPVAFAFQGQDAGSGIEACDVVSYTGPDGGKATVGGACRDRAGNSTAGAVPLLYDGTPPTLAGVRAIPGRSVIRLHWRASPDAERVVVRRSPGLGARSTVVYRGKAQSFVDRRVARDVRYVYDVTAVDAHAKTSTRRAATTFSLLLAPHRGAVLRTPALLRWRAVAGASYYNVQLYRGGRLIRTAWPTRTSVRIRHLPPGHYRWYVWPGLGTSRAEARFGRLVGHSTFTVR
jgi:hypothetical protein